MRCLRQAALEEKGLTGFEHKGHQAAPDGGGFT
jgi:hypothetical protein